MQFARTVIDHARHVVDALALPDSPVLDPSLTERPAGIREPRELASLIEHTNLKPDATTADIRTLCSDAIEHGFIGVCVVPRFVSLARQMGGATLKVVTVVGFPSGSVSTESKIADVNAAPGADEFDMVIDIGKLKDGDYLGVYQDIRGVRDAVAAIGDGSKRLKVIVESGLLSLNELAIACLLSRRSGAHFVKTSTGFNSEVGATTQAVAMMRECVGGEMGIKASAGIRDWETAADLVAAGANRLGTSGSLAIIGGARRSEGCTEPGIDSSLEATLKHGRELFSYHAGQRLTSIRYFVIALSFFGVAWTSILDSDSVEGTARGVALLTLAIVSAVMTALFWLLDMRNVQLLDGSEGLLKEAEKEAASRTQFSAFETVDKSDRQSPSWIRYGNGFPPMLRFRIMPAFFFVFFVASVAAGGYSLTLISTASESAPPTEVEGNALEEGTGAEERRGGASSKAEASVGTGTNGS